MTQLRADPPGALGERPLESASDLLAGDDLPPTDAVILDLEGDARVVVRPSGTEPKLKAYLEVVLPTVDRDAAQAQLENIKTDLSRYFNR